MHFFDVVIGLVIAPAASLLFMWCAMKFFLFACRDDEYINEHSDLGPAAWVRLICCLTALGCIWVAGGMAEGFLSSLPAHIAWEKPHASGK